MECSIDSQCNWGIHGLCGFCFFSLVCSYGFDPFGLSKKPQDFDRYQAYELIHARWAMLGAAGFVLPEAFNKFGAVCGPEAVWWKVCNKTLASRNNVLAHDFHRCFLICVHLGIVGCTFVEKRDFCDCCTLLKMKVSALDDWSYMLSGRLDLNEDMRVELAGSGVKMNTF